MRNENRKGKRGRERERVGREVEKEEIKKTRCTQKKAPNNSSSTLESECCRLCALENLHIRSVASLR